MYYSLRSGQVRAVDGVSFEIDQGQTLGLVGESGCGKTSIALAIINLLPPNGQIVGGEVFFKGVDLTKLSKRDILKYRWNRISMIFQSAMNALNPVFKIGEQLMEVLVVHKDMSEKEAWKKVEESFNLVGLSSDLLTQYPHQLSGGMRQRAIIAMSLLCNPELIIADEPTTALDVVLQNQILQKIQELQKQLNFAMIVISHDISVIAETCKEIGIMYGGQIIEYADSLSLFQDPRHPYTKALLSSFPSTRGELKRLTSLPGEPPDLISPPPGCRFEPRCPLRQDICKKKVSKPISIKNGHYSLCHFARDLDFTRVKRQNFSRRA